MAKYFDFNNNIDENNLKFIASEIKNGKIAIIPTETVYGIGGNGLISSTVEKIYKIKNRDLSNPINLLVKDIKMIEEITKNISEMEYKLMNTFFPGPLTLILEKNNLIPNVVTAGKSSVGVRISTNPILNKLLEYSNVPIAAPSANISGRLSGSNIDIIDSQLLENVDYIIDYGDSYLGIESTIVKVIDNIPHILRPGSITKEEIEKVCGTVILDFENSPSSNLKHYQLSSNALLVFGKTPTKVFEYINNIYGKEVNPLIVTFDEYIKYFNDKNIISLGSLENLDAVSKNLFSNLSKAQSYNPSLIIIQGIESKGLGLTIMNRLLNICNNNFVLL